jgi:hypothetical protein
MTFVTFSVRTRFGGLPFPGFGIRGSFRPPMGRPMAQLVARFFMFLHGRVAKIVVALAGAAVAAHDYSPCRSTNDHNRHGLRHGRQTEGKKR